MMLFCLLISDPRIDFKSLSICELGLLISRLRFDFSLLRVSILYWPVSGLKFAGCECIMSAYFGTKFDFTLSSVAVFCLPVSGLKFDFSLLRSEYESVSQSFPDDLLCMDTLVMCRELEEGKDQPKAER